MKTEQMTKEEVMNEIFKILGIKQQDPKTKAENIPEDISKTSLDLYFSQLNSYHDLLSSFDTGDLKTDELGLKKEHVTKEYEALKKSILQEVNNSGEPIKTPVIDPAFELLVDCYVAMISAIRLTGKFPSENIVREIAAKDYKDLVEAIKKK